MMNRKFLFNKLLMGLVLLMGFMFLLVPKAQAQLFPLGPFIEPSITYEKGDTTQSNTEGEADGFGVGARLGMHVFESVFLAIDGRYSMPKFKNSSNGSDETAKSFNWGPVVGAQMPMAGLRLWGSYILGGFFDPDEAGGSDLKYKDTEGYRLGVGIRIMAFSLNLEYQQLEYKEIELETAGGTATAGTSLENDSWILSASFPIEL